MSNLSIEIDKDISELISKDDARKIINFIGDLSKKLLIGKPDTTVRIIVETFLEKIYSEIELQQHLHDHINIDVILAKNRSEFLSDEDGRNDIIFSFNDNSDFQDSSMENRLAKQKRVLNITAKGIYEIYLVLSWMSLIVLIYGTVLESLIMVNSSMLLFLGSVIYYHGITLLMEYNSNQYLRDKVSPNALLLLFPIWYFISITIRDNISFNIWLGIPLLLLWGSFLLSKDYRLKLRYYFQSEL